MDFLNSAEVRVLGSLIEKEATTPEYYPLSLNALVNACNQKSNREPVVDYDETTVREATEGLRAKGFAIISEGGRVLKYSQRFSETLNLGRRELAVLCVLFLRGPQTLGEIRDRSERLFSFSDLTEVEGVLDRLSGTESGPLVKRLPRQPGQKEVRFAHLLSGDIFPEQNITSPAPLSAPGRIDQLEQDVAQLRSQLNELAARFEALESQLR